MPQVKQVSEQVFDVFHGFTPLVEGLSLDEAFLDVTASQDLLGDATLIADGASSPGRITQRFGIARSEA